MAVIAPLRAVYFNTSKVGSLDSVLSPPYDVIDAQQNTHFAKKQYNMVHLDLPQVSTNEFSSDRYESVATTWQKWLQNSAVEADAQAAIYYQETRYRLADGSSHLRKGCICLVELADFNEGIVLPHEHTFDAVVTDRLELMTACRAQFSQVFSLFSDPDGLFMRDLENSKDKSFFSAKDNNGHHHQVYRISDGKVIRNLQQQMLENKIYIADGHHRYTTALRYRARCRGTLANLPRSHPANWVMMYLSPMEDPGLSILPTHRLFSLAENTLENILALLQPCFTISEIAQQEGQQRQQQIVHRMEGGGDGAFGLYLPKNDKTFLLQLKDEGKRLLLAIEPCLQNLDVMVLSELIVTTLLNIDMRKCEKESRLHYISSVDEAYTRARELAEDQPMQTQLLFLLNSTQAEEVKTVADNGCCMPHKSTYFYPKVVSGLIMNSLDNKIEI